MKLVLPFIFAIFFAGTVLTAQPNPIVKMTVTRPDGHTEELSAPESGLATFALKDGSAIGVRPTIVDAKPWTHVVVTFFRMPTATHPTEEIGEIEAKTGGPEVQAKTNPSFTVAVVRVSEPAVPASPTSTH